MLPTPRQVSEPNVNKFDLVLLDELQNFAGLGKFNIVSHRLNTSLSQHNVWGDDLRNGLCWVNRGLASGDRPLTRPALQRKPTLYCTISATYFKHVKSFASNSGFVFSKVITSATLFGKPPTITAWHDTLGEISLDIAQSREETTINGLKSETIIRQQGEIP